MRAEFVVTNKLKTTGKWYFHPFTMMPMGW